MNNNDVKSYLGLLWQVYTGPLDGAIGRCTSVNRSKQVIELRIDKEQLWHTMRYQFRGCIWQPDSVLVTLPMDNVKPCPK